VTHRHRHTKARSFPLWLAAVLIALPGGLLCAAPRAQDGPDFDGANAVPRIDADVAPPPEVLNVRFADADTIAWDAAPGAGFYNIYRGRLSDLVTGTPPQCHAWQIDTTSFDSIQNPASLGEIFIFLVTAESTGGEGTPGQSSAGAPRSLRGACGPVMRAHVLSRTGFGWDEWSAARLQTLGIQGYIDEQLDPAGIDESGNTALNSRMALYDPPTDIFGLIARQVIAPVYARRQLEHRMTVFWANHFNTYWQKVADIFTSVYPQCGPMAPPSCDVNFPQIAYAEASLAQHREMERFRDLGFNGSFREIVQASALSPAMILYLDSFQNINLRPNENYARELLELYTMGVDGGYTQKDVEELARILTGWTICKKEVALAGDPTAPCILQYWLPNPPGVWTAHFDMSFIRGVRRHDCGQKVLFEGTPHEVVFPATPCLSPQEGVTEFHAALDALVAHPSTPRFMAKKILQQLVTDEPAPAMIDALAAAWTDAGNPQGIGDLREVTRAALEMAEFRSPDQSGSKIRTPLEQFAAALRATRGATDGLSVVVSYLISAQHIPHYNEAPTGYAETGPEWLDTNNTLTRQNFGLHLSAVNGAGFGSDPIGLLAANGVSTLPGNEGPIVDFFARILFGGALTPVERQRAITFLTTDDLGAQSPYNAARIRETVGLMLGYPQFQEQ